MKALSNGIVLCESPFDTSGISICLSHHGAIRDFANGIVGFQHLSEHRAFSFNNPDARINAFTSLHDMCFIIDNIEDISLMNKILHMWFLKNKEGIQLTSKCDLNDLKRCVMEISNEYDYRSVSFDMNSLFYFILMKEKAFNFCGNLKTFTDLKRIMNGLEDPSFISPSDIVILYEKGIEKDALKKIITFFDSFKPMKPNHDSFAFPIEKYYGKKIESNTSHFQIIFKFDEKHMNDLMLLPIFIYNAFITNHPSIQGCYLQLIFFTSSHFLDFLFLLEHQKYMEFVSTHPFIDQETYVTFLKRGKVSMLHLNERELFTKASPIMSKILDKMRAKMSQGEYVVMTPYDDFSVVKTTLSGEHYRIEDFTVIWDNYIYDYRYKSYMYQNHDQRWNSSLPIQCYAPHLDKKLSCSSKQKSMSLEETIKSIVYYYISSMETPFTKTPMDNMLGNEVFDIQLNGHVVKINTRYNFSLFLMNFMKTEFAELYGGLLNFLHHQKDLGNIYYHKIHFLNFQDNYIVILFSSPSEINKWTRSMINLFASINFTQYHVVQSIKSDIYDLSGLSKNVMITI